MSVDPVGALVALLGADTTVAGLVTGRIYGGELPEGVASTMPVKAIVVRRAGGAQQLGGGYQQWGDALYQVLCYGETPHTADTLHVAVHGALKQARRSVHASTLVHWCSPAGGPISLRDPELQWPYVVSVWQALTGEVVAQ